MRRNISRSMALVLGLGLIAGLVGGARAAEEATIDDRALEHVKTMSAYLAGLKSFRFHTEESAEGVASVAGGRVKVQYGSHREVAVKRPGQFTVDVGGDLTRRKLWVQDGKLTLLDLNEMKWMVAPVDADPKETLQTLRNQAGMIVPLAALVSQDLEAAIREQADLAAYLGIRSVGDQACHHVVFRAQGYIWQLWIAAGDRPLPRKFVVTDLSEAEQPQQTVRLKDWKLNPWLRDSQFKPAIPEKAEETQSLGFVYWVPAAGKNATP